MVVEDVAVGKQPLRPGPGHVQVLRLVRIDGVGRRVRDAQQDHPAEQRHERQRLRAAKRARAGARVGGHRGDDRLERGRAVRVQDPRLRAVR